MFDIVCKKSILVFRRRKPMKPRYHWVASSYRDFFVFIFSYQLKKRSLAISESKRFRPQHSFLGHLTRRVRMTYCHHAPSEWLRVLIFDPQHAGMKGYQVCSNE
ncbi:hypothetical protein FGO68_gene4321 [Halteria grandinella]|uniref:Uncharacterized protein n=1 Tax=Halteria grandinella TaxID=5974 RepID=A0A8J8SUA6_HALGN|nr:hypothetical protein FGO68_gene4321 [Halteria grandinella]